VSTAGGGEPDFRRVLAGVRSSHGRLLDTVGTLTPKDTARPSLLPEWTVGHVLSHLARNADSHTHMLEAAARGEHVEQYPGGPDERATGIEAGAARPGDEVLDDVRRATDALEAVYTAMPEEAWDGHGLSSGRPWPCRQIVFHRWREVELHHVDLGLAYTPADWPDDYVALELPIALYHLPERLDAASRSALFAWLVGRRDELGNVTAAPWQSVRYSAGGPWSRPSGV
jgi:maleylpyruvate isomerase